VSGGERGGSGVGAGVGTGVGAGVGPGGGAAVGAELMLLLPLVPAHRAEASRRSRSVASLAGESVMKGADQKVFDWARLDEYASYLHEQDALRQKLGVNALQKKLKMDLDQQVSEKNKKKGSGEEDKEKKGTKGK